MAIWDKWLGVTEEKEARNLHLAKSGKISDRLKIAKSRSTAPELLYYLAENDPDADVRLAVAKNKSTPVHASRVLATDPHQDVRFELMRRLVKLLPNLSEDRQSQLYNFAIQALGTLALDEVLKIRVALSTTLKDHVHAPPAVVGQLARDVEREVSEPVLKFCAALSDDVLLDILKTHPASWAVQAIAGRNSVSEPVSQAVIDQDDEFAGRILLENKGAKISTPTLATIVEKAKNFPQWQKPIAIRKNLPKDLAKELAQFVDDAVRNILLERTDFDQTERDQILQIVKRRLAFMDEADTAKESAEIRVKKMIKDKSFNEDAISDALAVHDKELVILGLAALVKTNRTIIEKIFALHTPKPVIAVSWRAGLSMRMCLRLQQEMAAIPSAELIYPKGGTDYPLDEIEMLWQLEFFSILT